MLARQAWRLLTIPDTLVGQVLKAKYYSGTSILQCKAKGGISYSWRSILEGVKLLKKGIIWRIGDGNDTKIWSDPWIPRGITRRPITPRGSSLLTKVSELIDPVTGTWDEQLVTDTFWPEDANVILTIPTDVETTDWPAWHFDCTGNFSVKSAYKLAVQFRDWELGEDASSSMVAGMINNEFSWHKIWQLKFPNKVKMFIWRLAHNSLPVRRNLARRGVQMDTICPVCHRLDEDCGHLFFKCRRARECWQIMSLENIRIELELCTSGKETVMRILNMKENERNKVFIWMWRWWAASNKANAGEKMPTIADIIRSVNFHIFEYEKLNAKCDAPSCATRPAWKPPPVDVYKINVDASFHEKTKQGGWGFVARDYKGNFLEGGAGMIVRAANALQAETLGVLRSLERAAALGMTRIILETDAAVVGKAITSTTLDRSTNGCLFRQIREFMVSQFVCCTVSICSRLCNRVADALASFGCTLEDGSSKYMSHIPDFVSALVSSDLTGACD